jgi:sugar phosphate isomerase/epimerase
MRTRTGGFGIGFRRGWGQWQKDLASLAGWAAQQGFEVLDLGQTSAADIATLRDHSLRLGSADLLQFGKLLSADPAERQRLIEQNVSYVREATQAGAKIFFTCIIPSDMSKSRAENYALAVEAFRPIAEAARQGGAKIAIEGYPGSAPHYPSLCCSPETVRAIIRDLGADVVGVNYDPSHLIRLGVDHIRFLHEFAGSVFHVHAKDTEILSEAVYEYGLYQGAAFAKGHGFGAHTWRYTLPGHGVARWTEIFRILQQAGYTGAVCVELEDENFNGSEDGEKEGLLRSLDFLRGA